MASQLLKEFRVHNFKLLLNVTFSPSKVNLLIGKNNTGKTSLCQAMKFLSRSTMMDLKECVGATSGIPQALPHNALLGETTKLGLKARLLFDGVEYDFDYDLAIRDCSRDQGTPQMEVVHETLHVSGGKYTNMCLLSNDENGVKLLHEVEFAEGNVRYAETYAPRDATMLKILYDVRTNRLAHLFKTYLRFWCYYSLNPTQIRSFIPRPDDLVLAEDGSNLASMLHRLKSANERDYRELLKHVNLFDPSIDAVNFFTSAGLIAMTFADSSDRRVMALNSSNGTLQFLAILYVLLAQPKIIGIPSLFMIEEPENGIFVGELRKLVQLADMSPNNTQIIFTTHSPYLIDLFDNKLDGVFVMKRDETHAYIRQPDQQIVDKYLGEHPLGQLYFQGLL